MSVLSSADRALMAALDRRNAADLQRALQKNSRLDRTWDEGEWTPLHQACADGWLAGVEILMAWLGDSAAAAARSCQLDINTAYLAAPSGLLLVEFLLRLSGAQPLSQPMATAVRNRLPEPDRLLWDLRWQPS